MKNRRSEGAGVAIPFLVLSAITLLSIDAMALDGYQDRKGFFSGIGLGGGAAVIDGDAGGDMMFDLQLGGGIGKRLTIALDVDFRQQFVNVESLSKIRSKLGFIVPGPELTLFLTKRLFLRGGVGLALVFLGDEDLEEQFTTGFNGGGGVGFEFFMNSNVAIGLAGEIDYFVMDGYPNIFYGGFSMGIRFY